MAFAQCTRCGDFTYRTILGRCETCYMLMSKIRPPIATLSYTNDLLANGTSLIFEINGKEVARAVIGEFPTNERTTGLLKPYMQDLLEAGFALDTVLERGYDFAEYLVTKELRHESKSCDELEVWPRTASLMKDVAETLGISRKQQEQAMEKHS